MSRRSRRSHTEKPHAHPPERPEVRARVPWSRRLLAAALWASTLVLLAGALPVWPAQYDFVLRSLVTASALFAAYAAYEEKRTGWVVTLGIIAVGFNPVWPLGLSRGNWVATYLVVALVFLAAAVRFRRAARGIFKPRPRIP